RRPLRAVQRRRTGGTELGGRGHQKRRDGGDVGQQRRRVRRVGRLPIAGRGGGRVIDEIGRTVILALGNDGGGDAVTNRRAVGPRLRVGHTDQRRGQLRIERRLLRWEEV